MAGPPERREGADGGVRPQQGDLPGGGHDPRCLHYEWGPVSRAVLAAGAEERPCSCAGLAAVDEERRRQWVQSLAALAAGEELDPRFRLVDTGAGRAVGYATKRQVEIAHTSQRAGLSGMFFVGPNGELVLGHSMPEGYVSRLVLRDEGPPPWAGAGGPCVGVPLVAATAHDGTVTGALRGDGRPVGGRGGLPVGGRGGLHPLRRLRSRIGLVLVRPWLSEAHRHAHGQWGLAGPPGSGDAKYWAGRTAAIRLIVNGLNLNEPVGAMRRGQAEQEPF